MKRFLIAVVLCALAVTSGAWTLQWNPGSDWPTGTTVIACVNGECVNGITGTSQSFSAVYPAGTVLHGTAQAVPPAGYQCGEPLAPCPPSIIAEISQTIPADQSQPDKNAWTIGNQMADPVFGEIGTAYISANTAVSSLSTTILHVASGDFILVLLAREQQENCTGVASTSPALTFTKVATIAQDANISMDVWAAIATASASSMTISASYSDAQAWGDIASARWSNAPSSITPVQSSTLSQMSSATTNRTATNVTTTQRTLIIATGSDWDSYNTHTATTNWTKRIDSQTGGTNSSLHFLYDRVANAGTYPSGNYGSTNNSDRYVSSFLAFPISAGATYTHTASGGIATGGTATLKRAFARSASGGIATGGAAALKRVFANQATGGIATGGAASTSKSSGNSYIATGGITTGGAATLKRTQASTASGGISTGGTGGLKLVKTVSGSGGIATGGAAALKRAFARFASGGLATGGTAPLKIVKTTTATGGIVTGGAATASKSSPGQNSYTASGGVTTGGAATLKRTQTAVGAGGIATGGAATLKRSFARLATGGLSTGGAAVLKRIRAYLASGGLTTGGAASVTLTAGAFSYVASGGIATGGSASLRILLHYLASGGVTIGGAASAYAWSSVTALPHGNPAFARLSSVAAMERIPPLARVA